MTLETTFWEHAVIYQVYPRSFREIRSDTYRGEGSIAGITDKLSYLQKLGVDAVWLSPFYPSPMNDNGYDVMDYMAVDDRYGTLDDFRELMRQASERGMKIMVDFVPNHTSDQHPWFLESAGSRDNSKADWYIWRDAKPDGSVPNNWASVFSLLQLARRAAGELDVPEGEPTPPLSAWKWHEGRGQYYLHTFAESQPDLDWSNPAVQAAMTEAMRFWIDLGVDGFRIDAVNHIGKNLSLADDPPNPDYHEGGNPYDQLAHVNSANHKTLYDYLRIMTGVFDEPAYHERDLYMIFETYVEQELLDAINAIAPGRAAAFNFETMNAAWNAQARAGIVEQYLQHLPTGSVPNYVNGNHDNTRIASRLGRDAAMAAAVFNATLPGQMYIYQGEEANWLDGHVAPEMIDDTLGGRDPERTPMAWNESEFGGFSKVQPWLPVDDDHKAHSIAAQWHDPSSSVNRYRMLLSLRRTLPALRERATEVLATSQPDTVLAYRRGETADVTIAVIINMSDQTQQVDVHTETAKGTVIFSSLHSGRIDHAVSLRELELAAHEAVIVEIHHS